MIFSADPIGSIGTDIDCIGAVLSYYKNGFFYFFFIVMRVSLKGLGWPSCRQAGRLYGGIMVFGDVSLNQTDIIHGQFSELILFALTQ